MLNAHEIKGRIKSIEETRQITNAIQLISASKLKKAIKLSDSNLKYFKVMRSILKDILMRTEMITHPYFVKREGKRVAFLVIASDKGLAGEFNKRVLELAYNDMKDYHEKYIFTIGKKATEYLNKHGIPTDIEFLKIAQNPTLDDARHLTMDILELYDQNILDEVHMTFTSFEGKSRQYAQTIKLLPLERKDFEKVESFIADEKLKDKFVFVPSPQEVFDVLIPQYMIGLIYGALVQSSAAEHFERMIAMKSSLDNADKMLKTLKLKAQRVRQEKITTELQEISMAVVNNAE